MVSTTLGKAQKGWKTRRVHPFTAADLTEGILDFVASAVSMFADPKTWSRGRNEIAAAGLRQALR